MSTKIQPLPQTTTKNGYHYTLLKRSDKAALYEQKVEKEINGVPGETVGYEVIFIKVSKSYSLTAKPTKNNKTNLKIYTYPAAEVFPGNGEWGKFGWTYNTLNSALCKFKELNAK